MNKLTLALASVIATLTLIAGGQQLHIISLNRQSAVWQERVAADSVRANRYVDSLSTLAQGVAARDSVIASIRGAKAQYARRVPILKVTADSAKQIAVDSARADSVRLKAYEAAVAALETQVQTQATIIGYQERELAQEREIRASLEEAVQLAQGRIAELEALIAAAPSTQTKGKGNVFKVVGGFLAGVGVGVLVSLIQ